MLPFLAHDFLPFDAVSGIDQVEKLIIQPLLAIYKGDTTKADQMIHELAITIEEING
jgi:hypothetical protein